MSDKRYYTFNGADVAEAKINGISYKTFHQRVNTYGWDIDRAKTEPIHQRRKAAKA